MLSIEFFVHLQIFGTIFKTRKVQMEGDLNIEKIRGKVSALTRSCSQTLSTNTLKLL